MNRSFWKRIKSPYAERHVRWSEKEAKAGRKLSFPNLLDFYPHSFDSQTIPFDSHLSVIFCYRNCYTKVVFQKMMRYENDFQGRYVRIRRVYRCIPQTKPIAKLLRNHNVYKQKLHKMFFYDKIILVSIIYIYIFAIRTIVRSLWAGCWKRQKSAKGGKRCSWGASWQWEW